MKVRLDTGQRILLWAVGICALLLYTLTAAPGIVAFFDDSLEFQLVGPTFGIAHPTGYPLYTLMGGVWSRLIFPFGNWAWRMNLLSALAAASTILLIFLLARHLVRHNDGQPNTWAGLAAALAYALGPVWWQQATIAEVYTLHGLFVVALLSITVGVGAVQQPDRGALADDTSYRFVAREHSRFQRRMILLCFLIGLALTHHRTTLLLLPGILLYLLWSVPGIWRPRRAWFWWAVAITLPLLLYLVIPLRAAMGVLDLNGSYVNSWQGFWNHVLARGYAGFLANNPLAHQRPWNEWLDLFRTQFGWSGLLLGLLGTAWLFDRRGRSALAWTLVALILITNLLFAVNYKVADVEVFLLPAFLAFALFVGAGVGLLARFTANWPNLSTGLQALLLLVIALGLGDRGPIVNRSQDWTAHDYATLAATVPFPPDSYVIGLEGEMTAIKYMQQAEGLAVNATVVVADNPDLRKETIQASVEAAKPTYITRELAGIDRVFSFSAEGPLVHVWPHGQAQAGAPSHPLDTLMAGNQLRLEGYDLNRLELAGGDAMELVLYWHPLSELAQVLKVSLRLLDTDDNLVLWPDGRPAVEDRFPLRQVAFTPTWLPGERVRDVHYVPIPPDLDSQPHRLLVIVYDAQTTAEVGRWETEIPAQ